MSAVAHDHAHDHDHDHDEHESHAGHDHHDHEGEHEGHHHHHAEPPAFLPDWAKSRWSILKIGLAAICILLGIIATKMLPDGHYVGIAFFLGAYYLAGAEVAKSAIPALFRGELDTHLLMLLAAIGAAILGQWAEGAFLLCLFALGHAIEDMQLDKARNAINALRRLMPDEAYVEHGDHYHMTPIAEVQVGDVVLVKPGERIPVDGVVIVGSSAVDQSAITGESAPITKNPGDDLYTGTVNHSESLKVRVTSVSGDTTLARVVELVEQAQSQHSSKTQQWVTTFMAKFVPAVLIMTGLVMVVPTIFGWLSFSDSFYKALTILVAASPCALAIGIPAAMLSAHAQAARNGVLIKGGVYLETLAKLDAIAFDKTGTLTAGRFSVQDVESFGVSDTELLAIAGAVESLSNHPLAKAIVDHCDTAGIELPVASSLENLPGLGIRGYIDGKEVLVGSLKMFETVNVLVDPAIDQMVESFEESEKTVMVVGYDGQIVGVIALQDAPRPNTDRLIQALKHQGVRHVIMLTGDNEKVAKIVATHVGIDEFYGDLLPEDKLNLIRELDDKYGRVAMVGDGVNDAPALAATELGIAMGGMGSDVALETADVVLLGDNLDQLPFAMGLAKQSQRIVKQNLAIALGVIIALITSILVVGTPIGVTIIFHEGSTVLVALNALRLLGYKQRKLS